MSTKQKFTAGAIVALLTVGAAGLVHAQGGRGFGGFGPGGPGGRGPGGHFGALRDLGLRQLDLSDAQQEQVRGIFESHRAELQQQRERHRAAAQALQQAVTANTLDEALVRARSAEVAAVEADAAVLRARIRSEVWSILTAEQQQRAAQLKAEAAQRRSEREQRRQRG